MDGISELARMFKERENPSLMGIQTGKILSPFPEIKIGIGDKIILDKDNLKFAAHLLNNYTRKIQIPTTDNVTSVVTNNNSVTSIGLSGTINFTDTLNVGDDVILIPTADEQLFYVIDKAVKL